MPATVVDGKSIGKKTTTTVKTPGKIKTIGVGIGKSVGKSVGIGIGKGKGRLFTINMMIDHMKQLK